MPLIAWKANATNTRYSPILKTAPLTAPIALSQASCPNARDEVTQDVQHEVAQQAEPGDAVQGVEVALDAPAAATSQPEMPRRLGCPLFSSIVASVSFSV